MFPTLQGAADAGGIVKQVWNLGTSLVNPERVRGVVGTVARPIKKYSKDIVDPNKSPEENQGKREPTILEKVFARITWLHVVGALGLVGSFVKPIFDQFLGDSENPNLLRKAANWILNPAAGIGALVLSEISLHNKWHVADRDRLEELGVLEKVSGTKKWKQLEVEKHINEGTFPMKVDDATRLLLEVRCSPKHTRATCYEGTHGQGKTLAAYISSYMKVQALKAQGRNNIEALQINAPKLMEVAAENIAKTAQMSQYLGENLKSFVSMDPMTYANNAIESELSKGSVVINDDAEYQLRKIDNNQGAKSFQWLRRMTEEYGGNYIITIPKSLKEVLCENKEGLSPTDIKTLLQRIDSISFPFENHRRKFDHLDEKMQKIVTADISESYAKSSDTEKSVEFHQCYMKPQQVDQWWDCINKTLLDGGEKFGRDTEIGKTIQEYFTENLNNLVSSYPMNPRYIGFTIDSLAILLDNRRNQSPPMGKNDIDFLVKTVLECDTFKNYIRSIDYGINNQVVQPQPQSQSQPNEQDLKNLDILLKNDAQLLAVLRNEKYKPLIERLLSLNIPQAKELYTKIQNLSQIQSQPQSNEQDVSNQNLDILLKLDDNQLAGAIGDENNKPLIAHLLSLNTPQANELKTRVAKLLSDLQQQLPPQP